MAPSKITSLGAIPSFKDDMSLQILVPSDKFTSRKSAPIPLFHGGFGAPSVVPATVTLQLDKDTTADELTFEFNVHAAYKAPVASYYCPFVITEKYYLKKNWKVDLKPSSSKGKIAAGTYSKSIRFEIDPSWPSSIETVDHPKGQGWVKYEFKATLKKKSLGGELAPVLLATQEIWILNSIVLPPDVFAVNQPYTFTTSWMKKTLPVFLSVPSKIIKMNEHVPVTINLGPFTGKYAGENTIISEAYLTLRENISGRAQGHADFKHSRDVVSIPINDIGGTPGPLTKTIHITFPNVPEVSPFTETKWLDVSHSIVLTMNVKVGKKKEKETIESPIQLIIPQPQHNNAASVEELLPAYGPSSENTQLPLAFKSLDIKS